MEKKVCKRISDLLKSKRISTNQLAKTLGISPSSVYGYLSGESKPPMSFLVLFLLSFPDVSAEWLIRGEGQMFKPAPHERYLDMSARLKGAEPNEVMDAIRSLDERLTAIEQQMKK
jgi:transcriptional regulator with XRE-family HTH domain